MTILYHDPVFLTHKTGQHPEQPARLRSIQDRLDQTGLTQRCTPGAFTALPEADLLRLHGSEMIAHAREVTEQGGGFLDGDTVVSRESFRVAQLAAGACVAAVDAVLSGADTSALCLIRPPGHHATPERCMGFCLVNNIALAADHARKKHGLQRILIVDWDVHHGNGTQDIFYANPGIFFLSIHRYGHGFYPGTGAADETGTGSGLGFTKNLPIRFGTERAAFRSQFRNAVETVADQHRPELILLSAGFDAHVRDPIGSLGLESEDFGDLTRTILDVARTHTQGRLVSCLEGGYHLDALAESVQAHLETLLG